MGFERSEQNNTVRCFVNGDRRFLHDVTKDNIRNVGQKSRTNPSLLYSKKGLRFSLFCDIIILEWDCKKNTINRSCVQIAIEIEKK